MSVRQGGVFCMLYIYIYILVLLVTKVVGIVTKGGHSDKSRENCN